MGDSQSKCEAILRANPDARFVKELHLASIEGEEQREAKQAQDAIVTGAVIAGVVGMAAFLLKKR
jgi:hypothetical protein